MTLAGANPGLFANGAFVHVAGYAASTITIETYDATNALLETLTIAAPNVASWGTSFLGPARSEGIRRVVFRGRAFGIDGLTSDATPLALPEPQIALVLLAALGIVAAVLEKR